MKTLQILCVLAILLLTSMASAQGTGFKYETVHSEGLSQPVDLTFIGESGVVVIEQCGLVQHFSPAGERAELANISQDVNCKTPDSGLIGVAALMDGTDAGYLFLYYTVQGSIEQRVRRIPFQRDGATITADTQKATTIVDDLPWAQNKTRHSGAIRVGPDNHVYIGVGDNGLTHYVQDLTRPHGKILRVRSDGSTPSDNPSFADAPGDALRSIYALGLGRPYRIAIDPETGQLWIGDIAASKYEEVSVSVGGDNFGWPAYEGDGHSGPAPDTELVGGVHTPPVYELDHSIGAPSSLVVGAPYRPATDASNPYPANFEGAVPIADRYENWVRFLQPEGDSYAAYETSGPASVRAIATGPDGAVYFVEYLDGVRAQVGRLLWDDDPPTVSIESPQPTDRYTGGKTLELLGSATDPEEGDINDDNLYQWTLTLYDRDDQMITEEQRSGASATWSLPAEIDIEGRLEITLRVKDSAGGQGSSSLTLSPEATRVTVGSDPAGVEVSMNGESITETTTYTYVAGTELTLSCPAEVILEDLYVFSKWSQGGEREQTYAVPNEDVDVICTYRLHSAPPETDVSVEPRADLVPSSGADAGSGSGSGDSGCLMGGSRPASGGLLLFSLMLLWLCRRRRVVRQASL